MARPRQRRQPARAARVPAVADAAVEAVEPGPEATVVAISLDAVLWLSLILIAAALRTFSLDRLPFSEAESARAFAAWAVAGSALVASFWFAGRYVGRGVALLAAALIALSPLAVYTSRSALGFALGGFLSMAMVLSLLAYLERPRQLPAVILFAAFGLALGSDPIATSTAVALIAFVTVEAAWRPGGGG